MGARPYALSAKMKATRGLRLVSFQPSFTQLRKMRIWLV